MATMPEALVTALQSATTNKNKDEFVVTASDGEMLNYHSFYKGLKAYCRRAGLTIITPHELRHSCTELMFEVGASVEDIRRQLNHASLTATQAYIHRTDDRLAKLVDRMSVEEKKTDAASPFNRTA